MNPLTALLCGLIPCTQASDGIRVERVTTLEESSFLPSWVKGSGFPALVHVVERGQEATLMLVRLGREPQPLSSGTGWLLNWADFPAASQLGKTRVWSWLETTPDTPGSYGTRFRVEGKSSSSAARPLEDHDGPGEHGFVSFTPLDSEHFLALWLDGRAMTPEGDGEMRVYARTIDREGALGPEMLVDPRVCTCCPTSLVRLGNGDILAAWRDRSESEVRDIALARFDGQSWSEPEALWDDGWEIDGCPVNGPRLSSGRGGCAASWYTGATGGAVLASFGSREGRDFSEPVQVDDGSPVGRGDVVLLADGSMLVGWMEHGRPLSTWRVRRVWPDGEVGPSVVLAKVSAERLSGFLRMTLDGQDVLAAYTQTQPDRRVVVERVVLAR